MGFFDRMKQRKADLQRSAGMVQYLSQFAYLPDISQCVGMGDWAIYRNKDGSTRYYVREDVKPLYVEDMATNAQSDQQALVLSYFTDKKGNSDPHYVIARGTSDALDVWFNVGVDFGSEFTAISKDGIAIFFDNGNDKLHVIDAEGNHKTMQLAEYRDYAGNDHGFFWWDDTGNAAVIKGFSFDSGSKLNKKIKDSGDVEEVWLQNDGIHVAFFDCETDARTERICDYMGSDAFTVAVVDGV